jgi:hypothetical protein
MSVGATVGAGEVVAIDGGRWRLHFSEVYAPQRGQAALRPGG